MKDTNNEQWYVGKFINLEDPINQIEIGFEIRDLRGATTGSIDPTLSLAIGDLQIKSLDTSSFVDINFQAEPYMGSGTLTETNWTFGDGETSTETNPTHRFPNIDAEYLVCSDFSYSHGCSRQLLLFH